MSSQSERLPHADEHVEWRFYENLTRKTVIERSDDLLTRDELIEHAPKVTQAILDELRIWTSFRCFQRCPRKGAPCITDVKWAFKWKHVKGERKSKLDFA